MLPSPQRTNATSLTDDKLILFDVLFNGSADARLLRRVHFAAQWNCASHQLDDEALQMTIEQFIDMGLLKAGRHAARSFVEMTATGASRWEAERRPAWQRYATESYGCTRSGTPYVVIEAVSTEARDAFWKAGNELGFFRHSSGRIKRAALKNRRLFSWKTFPTIHALVAMRAESGDYYSRELEGRRTWWGSVRENDKFFAEP